MAMLPILLDMVDNIYQNLDSQSNTFPDTIPLLFVPQRAHPEQKEAGRAGCRRFKQNGCGMRRAGCGGRQCQRGTCMKPASDDFKAAFDISAFKPEEVTVKVKGNEIIVEGKHEERQDEIGFVSRQFSRRMTVPEEFDVDTISSFVDAEGKMTITASKPKPQPVEAQERIIPIQRVSSAAVQPQVEQENLKDQAEGGEKVEPAA